MMKAVLDTNVVVSALLFRGSTASLHAAWKRHTVRLLVSDVSLAELARVLAYPKFRLAPELVTALLATEIFPFADRVTPTRTPAVCRDPDDDEFLWCARDGNADCLVTGDPDLLVLGPAWAGVPIITVAEALSRLSP